MKKSELRAELTDLRDALEAWSSAFSEMTLAWMREQDERIANEQDSIDLETENEALRAELTQLADGRDWWLQEFNQADAELTDYIQVNDELRTELTQLADELDLSARLRFGYAREIEELEGENDELRAQATEAYEHGVSDGIDMGKAFGGSSYSQLMDRVEEMETEIDVLLAELNELETENGDLFEAGYAAALRDVIRQVEEL